MAEKTTRTRRTTSQAGRARKKPASSRAKKAPASSNKTVVPKPLVMPAKLCIGNISELVDAFKPMLDAASESALQKKPIQLDISAVEQADTAAFQVLVSFTNALMKSKCEIQWVGESEILRKFSRTLALDQYLAFDAKEESEDDLCPVF